MPVTVLARRIAAGLLAFGLLAGFAHGSAAPRPPHLPERALIPDATMAEPGTRFALAVLPDTQNYSRDAAPETSKHYLEAFGSEPYAAQTQWIADHADVYGIELAMHLGDLVDEHDHPEQWAVANAAMARLERAGVPYSVLAGNHDVGARATDARPVIYTNYLASFSPERAAQNATFVARDPSGAHEYHLVEVAGQEFLILALSWQAQPESLAWAAGVLEAHPTTPTILTSHQLINVADDGVSPVPTDFGELVWRELIAGYDQVFLTYNGHHHGTTRWERTNDFGNPVHQVLIDYQMGYLGGNGDMALTEFDLTHGKIHQTSFSPWVLAKPAAGLAAEDAPLLVGANESFTIDFDFAGRFPGLAVGAPVAHSATTMLRESLTGGPVPPSMPRHTLPTVAEHGALVVAPPSRVPATRRALPGARRSCRRPSR